MDIEDIDTVGIVTNFNCSRRRACDDGPQTTGLQNAVVSNLFARRACAEYRPLFSDPCLPWSLRRLEDNRVCYWLSKKQSGEPVEHTVASTGNPRSLSSVLPRLRKSSERKRSPNRPIESLSKDRCFDGGADCHSVGQMLSNANMPLLEFL